MKYRLYVDETGNSDMGASSDPNHRYLSLTGVITSLDYVQDVIHPDMERLKQQYFHSHPDEPIILHRKELLRRGPPFHALRDRSIEEEFNRSLLAFIEKWDFRIVTITLDKLELSARYGVWTYHPYHYCLHVMLERYVMFLETQRANGDVMGESRGGREDRTLKASFANICQNGTDFVNAQRIQAVLTSLEAKLKTKSNNISGLQLADLIAYPSFRSSLASHQNQKQPEHFSGAIARLLLQTKYLRSPLTGQIEGWGRTWLP